jgi:ABC-type transport system involved in multi-copper enzyme maturation permease subunit
MNFIWNKSQLKKELHPLILPWCIAVIAGGLIGLRPLLEGSGVGDLLTGLAINGFFAALALLATITFGSELHERTLTLLLSHPTSRSRLWSQKMTVLSLGILTAALAEAALLIGISNWNWYHGNEVRDVVRDLLGDDRLALGGIFLLATACSCTFWTLVAGSTIGGLVFTVSGQFILALAAAFAVARFKGRDELFQDDTQTIPTVIVAGLIYSVVFLYLGRWKFLRLEVRARGVRQGGGVAGGTSWSAAWSRLLVSRPTSRIMNLIRKEVRLQKPVFQLAGAFIVCWLAVLILQKLQPSQNITYWFDILTCLYAPITCLLIGCISLGEEKLLGTTAAQLVLPFPASLLWLIKLLVCAVAAAVLGLALPLLLFWTTGMLVNLSASGLMNHNDNGIQVLAILSGLMFLLGYWAVSLSPNTVRAALVAIAGVILLPACAALGMYYAQMCFGLPHRETQSPAFALSASAAAAITLMLGQSLIRFRSSEEHQGKLVFYSAMLVGLILLVSFWATCVG